MPDDFQQVEVTNNRVGGSFVVNIVNGTSKEAVARIFKEQMEYDANTMTAREFVKCVTNRERLAVSPGESNYLEKSATGLSTNEFGMQAVEASDRERFAKIHGQHLVGDPLEEFEYEPGVLELCAFLQRRSDLASRYKDLLVEGTLVEQLAAYFDLCEREEPRGTDKSKLVYLSAFLWSLGLQFDRAFRTLVPLLEKGYESENAAMLAGLAGLYSGKCVSAKKYFVRVAQGYVTQGAQGDIRKALAIMHVGACCEEVLESEEALFYCELAESCLRRGVQSRPGALVQAQIHNNIGFSLMTLSGSGPGVPGLQDAERRFERCLEIRREQYDSTPSQAMVELSLAEVSRRQGSWAGARSHMDRAIGMMKNVDANHIGNAYIFNALGLDEFEEGNVEKAIEYFQEARRVLVAKYCDECPKYVYSTYSIAQAQRRRGDREAAETMQLVYRLSRRIFVEPDHPFIEKVREELKMFDSS